MQRYRIVAPFRFLILGSVLGPAAAGVIALVMVLLSLGFAAMTAETLTAVPSTLWTAIALIPLVAMVIGFVPALISSLVVLLAARWRPIAFVEVVGIAAALSLAFVFTFGTDYVRNIGWAVLVPVLPAAIATWLVARHLGYLALTP